MTLKQTTLALVTTLSLGLGALAIAGPPASPGPEHDSRIGRVVDLTDAQEAQLSEIRAQTREAAEALRASLEDNREALKAEMSSANPSKKRVHALIDEAATLKTEFKHAELDLMWSFLETLTPEQRAELAAARAEHPEWRPGHGRGGEGRDDDRRPHRR